MSLVGIYPNPTSNLVNIVLNAITTEDMELSIFDGLGNRLKYLVVNGINIGYNNTELNVSLLSSGLYYLNISQGILRRNFKITVLK